MLDSSLWNHLPAIMAGAMLVVCIQQVFRACTAKPLRASEEHPSVTVSPTDETVCDVTERTPVDDPSQAHETAAAASQVRSSFLARIRHELRTPLNEVIGTLDGLADSAVSSEQQRQLRIARNSTTSLLDQLDELVESSRAEMEQERIDRGRLAEASGRDSMPVHGRLLLADDDEINRMVAVELLKMAGWRVDVAANGLQAVAAVQHAEYDAILMDCQMPEMDGLTATREIRLLEAAGRLPRPTHELIPIIAFTANAEHDDRELCLAAGMNAFALKPLVIEQLLSTIEQAVGSAKFPASRHSAATKNCPSLAETCSTLL